LVRQEFIYASHPGNGAGEVRLAEFHAVVKQDRGGRCRVEKHVWNDEADEVVLAFEDGERCCPSSPVA
jgi:hypothetical protein